jgi:patatin-like phospholipase/acyl hydrolase
LQDKASPAASADRFQILSLDGGGVRGVFIAAILAAIEKDLNIKIIDHFDLIAGTSTGGIIAIALGLGLSPVDILEFYRQYGPRIFGNPLRWRSAQWWLRRKYSPAPLQVALRAVFRECAFGESNKRLVIPSYNLGEDDVYIFRTPHMERLRRDYCVPAWQVGLATSAAPTYFPACRAVDGMRLIDGGVWANNPALVAVVEAYGTLSISLEHLRVLSIGTYEGVVRRSRLLDVGGAMPWAPRVADILLRAGSIAVTNQVRFLIGKNDVTRLDPRVPAEDCTIDGVSQMEAMFARAMHYSRHFIPEIHERFMDHKASPYIPCHKP